MTMPGNLPHTPPAPRSALRDAIDTIRVYDGFNADERLERGLVVLAEAQAYALVSIAESLEQLAGESFRREMQR